MKALKSLFARKKPRSVPQRFDAPIAPEKAFFAIGDIHGCDALFARLIDRILARAGDAPIICVGDYVDRGEDNAAVLRRLMELDRDLGDRFVCLLGNHEDMLLKFLDSPEERGARWLRYGGLQTLGSFGLRGVSEGTNGQALIDVRDRLRDELGPIETWLRERPLSWQNGNVAVVHAGADPAVPFDLQDRATLMWGHRDFDHLPRQDGIWVVHGHTVTPTPTVINGRIAIDTGAYATGRLTAAMVVPGDVEFIQA